MLFNSYTFLLIFLPLVLVGWWSIRGQMWRLGFITLMSYAFYSFHEFPTGLFLLPILLTSTTTDYVAARAIFKSDNERTRKLWLTGALAINIGLLCWFKYQGMFAQLINFVSTPIGGGTDLEVRDLVLPLGISFYTFNSMSYTIDVYWRRVEPAKNFIHYSAFVSLFPHLLAGPIVRYRDMDTQFRRLQPRMTSRMVLVGMFFIICGMFKKVVVSDEIVGPVSQLWIASGDLGVIQAWAATVGFYLQLYFDYSGYADMAVGLALLLGFKFPQIFNSPFKSTNPSDFWKRWNATLTRWAIDYIFIPLGGTRGSMLATFRNILIVTTLMSLWHGALWTFMLSGLLFGIAAIVYRLLKYKGWILANKWAGRVAMVCMVTTFFSLPRSRSVETSLEMLKSMYGFNGLGLDHIARKATTAGTVEFLFLAELAALLGFVMLAPNTWDIVKNWDLETAIRRRWSVALALGVMAATSFLLLARPTPFLYFQF